MWGAAVIAMMVVGLWYKQKPIVALPAKIYTESLLNQDGIENAYYQELELNSLYQNQIQSLKKQISLYDWQIETIVTG